MDTAATVVGVLDFGASETSAPGSLVFGFGSVEVFGTIHSSVMVTVEASETVMVLGPQALFSQVVMVKVVETGQ